MRGKSYGRLQGCRRHPWGLAHGVGAFRRRVIQTHKQTITPTIRPMAPREINIIKSAECNRSARLLPAELVEDPPREQSEKDRPENNGNGGSKTCHETVENYSHYFWGAVTRCIH